MVRRVAAIVASRVTSSPVGSGSYPSFPSVPAGSLNVAQTVGAGNAQTVSNTLQEGNSSTTNGGYNSILVLPDTMSVTTSVTVTVTVGALSVVANNRGVGPGIFSADGTKGIYVRINSQSSTAALCYWSGGVETQPKTSTQVATAGDTITITGTYGSVTAGCWTWTVKKNGGTDIAAFTWTDSANLIDLPGVKPAVAFRHQYAAGQAPSRGVAALSFAAA